ERRKPDFSWTRKETSGINRLLPSGRISVAKASLPTSSCRGTGPTRATAFKQEDPKLFVEVAAPQVPVSHSYHRRHLPSRRPVLSQSLGLLQHRLDGLRLLVRRVTVLVQDSAHKPPRQYDFRAV